MLGMSLRVGVDVHVGVGGSIGVVVAVGMCEGDGVHVGFVWLFVVLHCSNSISVISWR